MNGPFVAIQHTAWMATVVSLLCSVGCGGKGSTKLTYGLPSAPIQFSIGMDKDGVCTVAGGLVTYAGTFEIEHSFPTREELTYIIIRNRTRGTDTIFKISKSGFVDLHAVGDHTFRMHRVDNKFYFDITSEWGTLDFKAYPSETAIARVDFGEKHPDAVVTNDRKLILEYPSIFRSSETLSLDTVDAVEFGRSWPLGQRWIDIRHKDGLGKQPLRLDIEPIKADANCESLEAALKTITPEIKCSKQVYWLSDVSGLCVLLGMLATPFALVGALVWFVRRGAPAKEQGRCLTALVIAVGLGESAVAQVPGKPALERADISKADEAKVREQWSELAPYLSMEGKLALENIDLATVGTKYLRLRELGRLQFDAHPLLQKVGPPTIAWLAASEARIIPTFRVQLDKVKLGDDDFFGGLILEGLSRLMEMEVLRAWQTEYDERLRHEYSRMMPLARAIAADAAQDRKSFVVECPKDGRGPLQVRNGSGQNLTNVTLAVALSSVSGPESMHYYFVPEWSADSDYAFRLAVDWEPIGAGSTTKARIEVLSDQKSCPPTEYSFEENVPYALRRLEGVAAANVQWNPSRALAQLTALKRVAADDPEVMRRVESLVRKARQRHAEILKSIDLQIANLANLKAASRRQSKMSGNRAVKDAIGKRVTQLDNAIKELRERKTELVKMTKGE